MIKTLKVNPQRISNAINEDYILATDLADYLVKKGMPFRQAHNAVSKLGEYAVANRKSFRELSLSEYRDFSPLFDKDVHNITLESSVAARNITGGTSPQQVEVALEKARSLLRIEQNSSQVKKKGGK
jgi:argininosuccinate lyase